jgi:hypothetical protein
VNTASFVVAGGIYFQEFRYFGPLNVVGFVAGVSLLGLGIYMLSPVRVQMTAAASALAAGGCALDRSSLEEGLDGDDLKRMSFASGSTHLTGLRLYVKDATGGLRTSYEDEAALTKDNEASPKAAAQAAAPFAAIIAPPLPQLTVEEALSDALDYQVASDVALAWASARSSRSSASNNRTSIDSTSSLGSSF